MLSTGPVGGRQSYTNSDGEAGVLDTTTMPSSGPEIVTTSWVQRVHPDRKIWVADETKQRASYIGTQRHLAPFLVPHRFEGATSPRNLPRAKLAYSIGLNSSYLQEIFGHIRGSPVHYSWAKLSGAQEDRDTNTIPKSGVAKDFWGDATGDGVTWTNFFERKVLEWMLTSPGGFVLVDNNRVPGSFITRLFASQKGIRSSLKFLPYSQLEDFGRGTRGYRWLKFAEYPDRRQPNMRDNDPGTEKNHVIFQLEDDGSTTITRYNDKGQQIGKAVSQTIKDMDGHGILPLVEVRFGEHPDINFMGAGLLMGLDDIVIDLYNLLTETREAYRDAVFTFLSYRGSDPSGVEDQLKEGSRFVHIGEDATSVLAVVGGDGGEVTAGLNLIDMGLKNWASSAKRRAMEATGAGQRETMNARSGTSLKAEFQLDLIPLMISICETLDAVETEVMFVLGQIEGLSPEEANLLTVRRETDFQMEQEASRIARIVSEFLQAIPGMPASLLSKLIMRWASSLQFIDLDEMVYTGDGTKKKLRDVISDQAEEIAQADQDARIRQNELGILGAAAVGAATGGNRNGGGNPKKPTANKANQSGGTGGGGGGAGAGT